MVSIPALGHAGEAASILMVDDIRANRELVRPCLQGTAYELLLATDGAEAVAAAGQRRFDLILMDVGMPGMDELEATKLIRAGSGPNARTPILALTAAAMPKDRLAT